MTIGAVAKQCGLQASAIRYYERMGLLPKPSRMGGRRIYGDGVLDRIAFVQFARSAGFSVAEIRALAGAGGQTPLSKAMRRMAERKLGKVERLIAQANLMKEVLAKALRCQCIDPQECGRKVRAAQRE
jgi:MerR family redox-sensitive transcriptional activator SoxR